LSSMPLNCRSLLPGAALALLLLGLPARAQAQPVLAPTRDVDITYEVTRPHQARIRERVRWLAAEHLERIDGPDKSVTIFDRKGNEITLLIPATRTYRKLEGAPRRPMEPEADAHMSPGEGAILVGMNSGEVRRVVQDDLAAVPYVAGVNNHMGSRATQDAALMDDVMSTLADRRLYFIDSRTTGSSTALQAAQRRRLPAFYRTVFLDNTETVEYTLRQLGEFRRQVEDTGVALAIGHPHATTITALAKFLPELERSDIELVPPSTIVRLPDLGRLDPRDKRE